MGSVGWAKATALAFSMLTHEECDEVAKPEWWNDEGLKALSARVVRAAPNEEEANSMRADVLSGGYIRLGGGASLGGGAQGGGHARRAGCGAVQCSGDESRAHRSRGVVPPPGGRHVAVQQSVSYRVSYRVRLGRVLRAGCPQLPPIQRGGGCAWACVCARARGHTSGPRGATCGGRPAARWGYCTWGLSRAACTKFTRNQ